MSERVGAYNSFTVGSDTAAPFRVSHMARASVVWNGVYYTLDVRTMSEQASEFNRVNVLGVITSQRAATEDERRTPRMQVMNEHTDQVDNYAIARIHLNQSGPVTMLEAEGIRDMAFRRTNETTGQMNERGLDALRELINEVAPIAEKHLPDREPNLMEIWRD
jgi:hypothetical protein